MFYTKGSDVIYISDDVCINFDPTAPIDIAREYAVWLRNGNTPEPWDQTVISDGN